MTFSYMINLISTIISDHLITLTMSYITMLSLTSIIWKRDIVIEYLKMLNEKLFKGNTSGQSSQGSNSSVKMITEEDIENIDKMIKPVTDQSSSLKTRQLASRREIDVILVDEYASSTQTTTEAPKEKITGIHPTDMET
ncbi:hypothetical protein SNEBB_009294 [Seison nebaliae]|nr:hypothetical protein SNEBB_009294 [Seison nebaliae]